MKSIRQNTFETNSSSIHSLTLTSKSEYAAWEKGDVILVGGSNFVPFTELYDNIKKHVENRIAEYEEKLAKEKDEKQKEYVTRWLTEAKEDLARIISVDKDQFSALSKEIILEDAEGLFDESYYDDYYYVDEDGKEPEFSEDIEDWGVKKPIADILISHDEGEGYVTEEKYYENDYYETFREEKKIDGVDVVAFGYYGHD